MHTPPGTVGQLNKAKENNHTDVSLQELMSAVEMEMTARLGKPEEASKFSRQHLANSLWALATLERLPSGRLLTALAAAMQERASDCNPQEISNTVWAFAKLGQPCSLLACCLLPVACCLLPVACCLLPVACCLLPVACCLLPVAWFPVHLQEFVMFCSGLSLQQHSWVLLAPEVCL